MVVVDARDGLTDQDLHLLGYVLETGRVVLADTGANLLVNDAVRKAYLGGA